MLLCPNHDALFDEGFSSFDDEGKVLIPEQLEQVDAVFMNVDCNAKIELTEGNKKHLEYHREHILR